MIRFILFMAFSILSINAFAVPKFVQYTYFADNFAADIFGDPSVTVLSGAIIELYFKGQSTIGAGNIADVTFTLQGGATFASVVSINSITTETDGELRWRVKAGGAIDDIYVTFSIEVLSDFTKLETIFFKVAELGNLDYLATPGEIVEIITSIDPTTVIGSSDQYWPDYVQLDQTDIAESIAGYTFEISPGGDDVYIDITGSYTDI